LNGELLLDDKFLPKTDGDEVIRNTEVVNLFDRKFEDADELRQERNAALSPRQD